MTKEEKKDLIENLELLNTDELIQIIIDQDKQIQTYENESEE